MALTPSHMLPLATVAPDFQLPDVVTGLPLALHAYAAEAPATLVMFICNHCPYVVHLKPALTQLARDYAARGVKAVAICSNDAEKYPDDAPENMRQDVHEYGYTFPYLYDESQQVAQAFDAACTPDFYLFDADLKLAYRGRFDASRPGNDEPVTGADLRRALDAVLEGRSIPDEEQKPSMGCNIKWKPGNEPR